MNPRFTEFFIISFCTLSFIFTINYFYFGQQNLFNLFGDVGVIAQTSNNQINNSKIYNYTTSKMGITSAIFISLPSLVSLLLIVVAAGSTSNNQID